MCVSLPEATPYSSHGSRSGLVAVTAVRPSSALASVSSLMLGDLDLPPFSVEPNVGAIVPGATQTFSIRFTPSEVVRFQGRLVCRYSTFTHVRAHIHIHLDLNLDEIRLRLLPVICQHHEYTHSSTHTHTHTH